MIPEYPFNIRRRKASNPTTSICCSQPCFPPPLKIASRLRMWGRQGKGTSCSRNRKHPTVLSGNGPPPTQWMASGMTTGQAGKE